MGHPPPTPSSPDPDPDDDVIVDWAKTVGSTLGWMGGVVPTADTNNGAATADEDDDEDSGRCLDWLTPMISE